jgi:type III restriction enzyme
MKLKFKHQQYQEDAVNAVIDCFRGQPGNSIQKYRYDIGEIARKKKAEIEAKAGLKGFKDIKLEDFSDNAFKNSKIVLAEEQLLENIQTVQKKSNNIDYDKELVLSKVSKLNLDIEMETGTGKTYCYIKTIFELNKNYGWSKFIIVVPSIAIREGVNQSFEDTAEHFHQSYHKRIRYFIYDSDNLNELDNFSSSADINVMIINTQAFNSSLKKPKEGSKSKNKAARKIFSELDDFGSRRPIDVIKANNPILIIDEPQKVEGDVKKSSKTFEALKEFNPLMILRYSATHKKKHNIIYRLDALDAYNQKLVKKIKVTGLSIQGLTATDSYLYLENFILSESAPKAMLEIEIKQKSGVIKRTRKSFSKGDNLFELSGKLAQYNGFVITEIDVNLGKLFFKNGVELELGAVTGDTNEETLRRIQIREAIKAHLEKEVRLFNRGIKVLSLFFIDEVAKYRLYDENSEKLNGDYAQVFEEEYQELVKEYLNDEDSAYTQYLKKITVGETHKGYFSIDKNKHLVNPTIKNGDASPSDYDLIMKEKKTLLSLDEPTRFIFSHSALREGWDNPNVFVICTLKQSSNDTNRKQEVGRGLRICVNHEGFRQDDPNTVHQINELTVVSSGPYREFVSSLQSDYKEIVAKRQRPLNKDYFLDKIVNISGIDVAIDDKIAKHIERYLVKNDYIDSDDIATDKLKEDIESKSLADFGELYEYKDVIVDLINNVLDVSKIPDVPDGRKSNTNKINKKNFKKKEFLELWNRINHKAIYKVDFESQELIQKAVSAIDKELQVKTLKYIIERGA